MSLGKTLIQKEIDRHRRSIQIDKSETIRLLKLKKEPEEDRMDDKAIDSYLDSHKKRTAISEPIIKELEADLKKL